MRPLVFLLALLVATAAAASTTGGEVGLQLPSLEELRTSAQRLSRAVDSVVSAHEAGRKAKASSPASKARGLVGTQRARPHAAPGAVDLPYCDKTPFYAPPRPRGAADRAKFVLITVPRSGSNTLTSLIHGGHPYVTMCNEDALQQAISKRCLVRDRGMCPYRRLTQQMAEWYGQHKQRGDKWRVEKILSVLWTLSKSKRAGPVGFKLMVDQLPRSQLREVILNDRSIRKIFLVRENWVARAVSRSKAARTNAWKGADTSKMKVNLTRADLSDAVRTRDSLAEALRYVDSTNQSRLLISYSEIDDMTSQPGKAAAVMKKIYGFVGADLGAFGDLTLYVKGLVGSDGGGARLVKQRAGQGLQEAVSNWAEAERIALADPAMKDFNEVQKYP